MCKRIARKSACGIWKSPKTYVCDHSINCLQGGRPETTYKKWKSVEESGKEPKWMCNPECPTCVRSLYPRVKIEVAVTNGRRRNDRDRKANGSVRANGYHPPVNPPTRGRDAHHRPTTLPASWPVALYGEDGVSSGEQNGLGSGEQNVPHGNWPGRWQVTPTQGFHGGVGGEEVDWQSVSEATGEQVSLYSSSDQNTLLGSVQTDADQETIMEADRQYEYDNEQAAQLIAHQYDVSRATRRQGYSYDDNRQNAQPNTHEQGGQVIGSQGYSYDASGQGGHAG